MPARGWIERVVRAVPFYPDCKGLIAAIAPVHIVEDERVGDRAGARPVPAPKSIFQRLGAMVHVEVPVTVPAQSGRRKIDLRVGARRDRAPCVSRRGIERERAVGLHLGCDAHRSPQPGWNGRGDLVDPHRQRSVTPGQSAPPDFNRGCVAREGGSSAFGHGPSAAPAVQPVKCDVHGAVIQRVISAGQGIVRRKNAADKGNQRKAVSTVVAEGVDVPPGVAPWGNVRIEARSASSVRAAIRPESAAIGKPGPGCVPPPAR